MLPPRLAGMRHKYPAAPDTIAGVGTLVIRSECIDSQEANTLSKWEEHLKAAHHFNPESEVDGCVNRGLENRKLENPMKFASAGTIVLIGVLVAGPTAAAEGKAVYTKACAVCHAAGVANAPRLTDKAAWAPRIKQGTDALAASVIKGKGAMPPRAGNSTLSDVDIKAAVQYMISQAK